MTLNGVALTLTQFQNMLKSHVINLNLASVPAINSSYSTDYGTTNTLTFSNGGANVTTTNGTVATITTTAVAKGATNNGYVYKVNQVLIPNQY